MAGIPVHALDSYLERLIKKGVMVAVCEQIEPAAEAKKRKGLVRRDVTRLYAKFECNSLVFGC